MPIHSIHRLALSSCFSYFHMTHSLSLAYIFLRLRDILVTDFSKMKLIKITVKNRKLHAKTSDSWNWRAKKKISLSINKQNRFMKTLHNPVIWIVNWKWINYAYSWFLTLVTWILLTPTQSTVYLRISSLVWEQSPFCWFSTWLLITVAGICTKYASLLAHTAHKFLKA